MGQPSSKNEMTIRHQFDRLCQMALKGEAVIITSTWTIAGNTKLHSLNCRKGAEQIIYYG